MICFHVASRLRGVFIVFFMYGTSEVFKTLEVCLERKWKSAKQFM